MNTSSTIVSLILPYITLDLGLTFGVGDGEVKAVESQKGSSDDSDDEVLASKLFGTTNDSKDKSDHLISLLKPNNSLPYNKGSDDETS